MAKCSRLSIAADGPTMDLLCDTLMVEELLPRLLPKSLLCLGAASHHYNALIRHPDFAVRYWQRAGVFFQPFRCSSFPELRPRFLGYPDKPVETESIRGEDLAFLPRPSEPEKAYLRFLSAGQEKNWSCYYLQRIVSAGGGIVVMHSAAGLLLCSRGRIHQAHFYVCNPVTWQWVALPELPWPSDVWLFGLLTVDAGEDGRLIKRFHVVLFNQPIHWMGKGGCFDLRIFSSDKGYWKRTQMQRPIPRTLDHQGFHSLLIQGRSGTAYWVPSNAEDPALAYNSVGHSFRFLSLPPCGADDTWNRIIGECKDGGLQVAHLNSSVLEVWKKEDGDGMWVLV